MSLVLQTLSRECGRELTIACACAARSTIEAFGDASAERRQTAVRTPHFPPHRLCKTPLYRVWEHPSKAWDDGRENGKRKGFILDPDKWPRDRAHVNTLCRVKAKRVSKTKLGTPGVTAGRECRLPVRGLNSATLHPLTHPHLNRQAASRQGT